MTSQQQQIPTLPKPGDLVGGRFRITRLLGSGGFGSVFQAMQENVGRDVALKFLAPSVAKDPVNIERFRREAFHVSQLRHPNTITLYDYGQTEDGNFFMVMELLQGTSLAETIQKEGAIERERAAHIFIQILKSLTEAHQRGLVHRDLKPENIHLCEMFGEQDYVKVLDFGVAKLTMLEGGEEEEKLTRAGRIFGTPMYMSPEQACAEPITTATDIYALGLLLFEVLTGLPPVTGRNRMDVIHKQIREEVPKLTPELKGTPLGDIIRKATMKRPEDRYRDASAMSEAFHDALRRMRLVPAARGATRPEISLLTLDPEPSRPIIIPAPQAAKPPIHVPSLAPAHAMIGKDDAGDDATVAQPMIIPVAPAAPAPVTKHQAPMPVAKPLPQDTVMTSAPPHVQQAARARLATPPPLPSRAQRPTPAPLPAQARGAGPQQPPAAPSVQLRPPVAPAGVEPPAAPDEPTHIAERPVAADPSTEHTQHIDMSKLPNAPQPAGAAELELIGRDAEIEQILGIVEQSVRAGSGHLLLLEGEGGVGKTRVVDAVRQELMRRSLQLGGATARRAAPALEALREAMAELVTRGGAVALADGIARVKLDAAEASALSAFLRTGRDAQQAQQAASASGLFALLERVILQLAEQAPVALVIEDIQQADSATLSFLEYIAVTLRTQAARLIVVLSLRSGERNWNPDLEQSLRTIAANVSAGMTRLRVRRLRGRELSVLLDAILPMEPRLKERIAWLSQGNPLHAIQIARYLETSGSLKEELGRFTLVRGTPREIDLPPDLMDMMVLRVRQAVSVQQTRPTLETTVRWLALLGIRVPVDLLVQLLGPAARMSRAEVEQDLEVLRQFGVIHQREQRGLVCAEFDNSLVREALLRDLAGQPTIAAMHRDAAEHKLSFYRQHQQEPPTLEIAEHWRQAGDAARYQQALLEAGRRSMRRYDPRGARDQFRELVASLDEAGVRDAVWAEVMLAQAELSRRFGEFGIAEDHYRSAINANVLTGVEFARAARGLAHLLFVLGRYPEAVRYYREALNTASQAQDGASVAKALIGLSRVHLRQGDPTAGAKVREKLEGMLRDLPAGEIAGKVLLHLAEAAQRQGQMQQRHAFLQRALEQFKASDDRQGLSDTLVELGNALMAPAENTPERHAEASRVLREALEIKRSIGDRHGTAEIFRYLGHLEQETDQEAAEHYYHQALRMHEALGAVFHIGAGYNSLGISKMLQGQLVEAAGYFDESIRVFERVGDQLALSHALLNRGTLAINQRDISAARTLLTRCRQIKEGVASTWGLYDLFNHLAIVELWDGRFDAADELLQRVLDDLASVAADEDKAVARSLIGTLRAFQSKLQLAALELGRARGDAEDMGIGRVKAFCQANACFYAVLTESRASAQSLLAEIQRAPILHALRRTVWIELMEQMARHTAAQERTRQSARLLRATAFFWQAEGDQARADDLNNLATKLES
jgi:serine/threonine protein kinase/tetratricopeptide (TPR) repeat protein